MKGVTLRIAVRYLFGRKSHSAVNTIALVSLCGIAVATAAIICVLSVFNGFREVLGERLDTLAPDILVTPAQGKSFTGSDTLLALASAMPETELAQEVILDQALALRDTREMPVMLKGVTPSLYRRAIRLDSLQIEGSSPLTESSIEEESAPATLAVGTAWQLGPVGIGDNVTLFAPRRRGRINLANPLSSFVIDSIQVCGVFQTGQSEIDDNMIITSIGRVRELLQYDDDEATALEITLRAGANAERAAATLQDRLGPGFVVKERLAQHEVNFRMVKIEKWVTFLLLVFILVIASFNLISTLSMLVLEKSETIGVLRALGISYRRIGSIFAWESWIATIGGGAVGMLVGSLLCLIQQHFGLIKLNGEADNLILSAYPVSLEGTDLIITVIPLLIVGLACSLTASAFARRLAKGNGQGLQRC